MAQMKQDTYIISISRLFKNQEPSPSSFLEADQIAQLEAVLIELVGDEKVMIEIDRDGE